jgi:uncharacterized protein YlxW (UPF0749 family)
MQIIISILALLLVAVAYLAIQFILSEEKEQKKKQSRESQEIVDLQNKLKQAQDELVKLKAERQEIEDLLYKAKDELDSLKTINSESEQKLKELIKIKDNLLKKEEILKQELADKEKLSLEIDKLKKDLDEASKLKEEQENAPTVKDVASLKNENEELKNRFNSLQEIHEGLQGQYDELSKQLEIINQIRIEEQLSKLKQDDGAGSQPVIKKTEPPIKETIRGSQADKAETDKPDDKIVHNKKVDAILGLMSEASSGSDDKESQEDIVGSKSEKDKDAADKAINTFTYLKEKAKEIAEKKEQSKTGDETDKKHDDKGNQQS